jgi:hypothetical protein
MCRPEQRTRLLSFVVVITMLLATVFSPTHNLLAQTSEPAVGPTSSSADAVDDASFNWQTQSMDTASPKSDSTLSDSADDSKTQQFDHRLYLPGIQTEEQAAIAHHNGWHTILFEGFEAAFPAGCWTVRDNNGGFDGIHQWDDTNTGAFSGSWSAHPNDGAVYHNIMDTHMRCGPLDLRAVDGDPVTSARLLFVYWLDTEPAFDFFSWEYSCNGTTNWTGGQSRSGNPGAWLSVNNSLSSCIGSANVYIRFLFRSDQSIVDNGVWVDNIRVQKFY